MGVAADFETPVQIGRGRARLTLANMRTSGAMLLGNISVRSLNCRSQRSSTATAAPFSYDIARVAVKRGVRDNCCGHQCGEASSRGA